MSLDVQQFALVALAHFLALLSPGPDFFLVLRSALVRGMRVAAAVCLGIALANGAFIVLAACGVGWLQRYPDLFRWISLAGALYIAWLGVLFIRHGGRIVAPDSEARAGPADLLRGLAAGLLSGLLNPKNSLFYASLFALLAQRAPSPAEQALYGGWMFLAVLLWDLAVAAGCRHPTLTRVFLRHAGRIERVTGVVLCGLAAGVVAGALR